MLHLTRFVQKTKAGQIRQGVKEHYVRDDLECVFMLLCFCGCAFSLHLANGIPLPQPFPNIEPLGSTFFEKKKQRSFMDFRVFSRQEKIPSGSIMSAAMD
jgi:hypothetical protein